MDEKICGRFDLGEASCLLGNVKREGWKHDDQAEGRRSALQKDSQVERAIEGFIRQNESGKGAASEITEGGVAPLD